MPHEAVVITACPSSPRYSQSGFWNSSENPFVPNLLKLIWSLYEQSWFAYYYASLIDWVGTTRIFVFMAKVTDSCFPNLKNRYWTCIKMTHLPLRLKITYLGDHRQTTSQMNFGFQALKSKFTPQGWFKPCTNTCLSSSIIKPQNHLSPNTDCWFNTIQY